MKKLLIILAMSLLSASAFAQESIPVKKDWTDELTVVSIYYDENQDGHMDESEFHSLAEPLKFKMQLFYEDKYIICTLSGDKGSVGIVDGPRLYFTYREQDDNGLVYSCIKFKDGKFHQLFGINRYKGKYELHLYDPDVLKGE